MKKGTAWALYNHQKTWGEGHVSEDIGFCFMFCLSVKENASFTFVYRAGWDQIIGSQPCLTRLLTNSINKLSAEQPLFSDVSLSSSLSSPVAEQKKVYESEREPMEESQITSCLLTKYTSCWLVDFFLWFCVDRVITNGILEKPRHWKVILHHSKAKYNLVFKLLIQPGEKTSDELQTCSDFKT